MLEYSRSMYNFIHSKLHPLLASNQEILTLFVDTWRPEFFPSLLPGAFFYMYSDNILRISSSLYNQNLVEVFYYTACLAWIESTTVDVSIIGFSISDFLSALEELDSRHHTYFRNHWYLVVKLGIYIKVRTYPNGKSIICEGGTQDKCY